MNLKILLPTRIFLDRPVEKVSAEAENGSFILLPRHVDFLAALAAGILSWTTPEGEEEYAAVDEGVLVKYGGEVLVSVANAVGGVNLGQLREAAEKQFAVSDEQERKMLEVLSRLEADVVRRLLGR